MAKKPSSEIVVAKKGFIEEVPSWVTEGTQGFEGTTAQDLVLPRLQLCQALSPQRKKTDPAYIEDVEEGDFFNSVSHEVYGQGPLSVTPLLCSKSRIKFNDPKTMGSGIECMGIPCAPDVKNTEGIACRLNNGGPCLHAAIDDDEPCMLLYNFPVILHDYPEQGPVVLSFKSTGLKIARTWLSMMKLRGKYPMYAMAFSIVSVDASTKKGDFKQVKVSNAGWTPKDLIHPLETLYNSIRNRVVLTDVDSERQPGDEDEEM